MKPSIYINGLVQDCGNSIANTLELLQSCTKPMIYVFWINDLVSIYGHTWDYCEPQGFYKCHMRIHKSPTDYNIPFETEPTAQQGSW